MRFGESATDQVIAAEERRQGRRVLNDGSRGLAAVPPESVDVLNLDDGAGNNQIVFVFGLHDPFDQNVTRRFPGST